MKKLCVFIVAIFFFSGLIAQHKEDAFSFLYPLEGMWLMQTRNGTIGEVWTKISNDHLQNKGFFIRGIDTTVTESIALKKQSDGIYYISTVENQNNKQPVPFKLTSTDNKKFVFENPDHDFPKRIVYEFVTSDSLYALIDGGPGATGKRQNFYFKRVR